MSKQTETLRLLQRTVQAKLDFWTAIRELELQVMDGNDFSDEAADTINQYVDSLASTCDRGGDITPDCAEFVINTASQGDLT